MSAVESKADCQELNAGKVERKGGKTLHPPSAQLDHPPQMTLSNAKPGVLRPTHYNNGALELL